MLTYLNFDLRIEGTGGTYSVQASSPAGTASGALTLPFPPEALSRVLTRLRTLELTADEIRELGETLFRSAFASEVLQLFLASQKAAHDQEAKLRLRLQIDPPELAELPWEYLFDPADHQFLALSVESPLIRYLSLPERPPLKMKPPLRILVAIASPRDLPPLDVEKEWSNVTAALGDSREVEVVRLARPTLDSLLGTLRRHDFHIFHFIGHGSFDQRTRAGLLMLEDESGGSHAVQGQYLGEILHDERTLRLAVVNACEGAAFSGGDPFAGVAQAIVQKGVPAVIAMQTVISDEAAILFARGLYSALADGYPVDAALTEARKLMFTTGSLEWGAPVLFLRSKDGRILDVEMPKAKPEATQQQPEATPPPEVAQIVTRSSSEPRIWLAVDNPPYTDWERAFAVGKVIWNEGRGVMAQRNLGEASPGDLILAYSSLGNYISGLGRISGKTVTAKKGAGVGLEIQTVARLERGISLDEIQLAVPDFRLTSRNRPVAFAAVSPEPWAALRALIAHHNPSLPPDALPPSTVPELRRAEIEDATYRDSREISPPGRPVFVKILIRNRGNVTWDAGEAWSLICRLWPEKPSSKPDQTWNWPLTLTSAVPPGESLQAGRTFPLPDSPGSYRAHWTVTQSGNAVQEPATRIDTVLVPNAPTVAPSPEEPQLAPEPATPAAPAAPVVIPQPLVLLSEPPPAERTMELEVDASEVTLRCGGRVCRSSLLLEPQQLLAAASPHDYGEALFKALFNANGTDGYESSTLAGYDWLRAQPGEGLRLQIELRTVALQQHKWEYLADPRGQDAIPLAALQTTPFYRRSGNARRPLATARPLRILAAIANPITLGREQDDQGKPVNRRIAALASLDEDRERDILKTALGRLEEAGIAEYLILDPPVTLDALREALQDGWHVLHLLAHGLHDKTGYHLILEDAHRRHSFVTAKAFRESLGGDSLRLVVLAACESAVPDTARSLRGLGQQLLDTVPAVAAMQDQIRIDTAQLFTQYFYDRLARTGRVDMAMARTRSALYDQGKEWQWGIPVLLMSTENGRLFDVDETRAATALPEVEPQIKTYLKAVHSGAPQVAPVTLPAAHAALASPAPEPLARPQDHEALRTLKKVDLSANELAEASRLNLPANVYAQITSALNAGKHVILIGPPGTGKTSLAHAVCDFASQKGFSAGWTPTTATADWTAFDTVGGYIPTAQQTLHFRAGVFLEAIRTGRWLVIDEINRAEIDKAFGELFTVLAGQPVDLPYMVGMHRVRVLPPKREPAEGLADYDYVMHPSWRIVATMNVYDKSQLFTLSFAFMRRFAFIDVDLPGPAAYQSLMEGWLQASRFAKEEAIVQVVREVLRELLAPGNPLMSCRELGPAIVKDMIEYMSYRFEPRMEPMDLLTEALLLYVTPQLDGIDRDRIVAVRRFLKERVGESGDNLLRRIQSLYPHVRQDEWDS